MVFLKSVLAGMGGVLAAAILLLVAGVVLVRRAARRNNIDHSGVGWDPIAMFGRFGLLAYFIMAFVVGFLLAWRKRLV